MNPDEIDEIPLDDEPLDEVEIEAAPPPPPKAETTAQANAQWADSLTAGDRATMTARAAMPSATEAERARARYLLDRHFQQSMGTEDTAQPIIGRDERPTAGLTGLAQGATLGFADEIGGLVRAGTQGGGMTGLLRGEGGRERERYRTERDSLRETTARARDQAPGRVTQGEVAGAVPTMALPGGGATALERIAIQGATGAGLGTLAGAGYSEGETTEEVMDDAAMGGALGAVMGTGGAVIGEGGRAALGGLSRAAGGADRARVASIATGTSRELTDTLMREAESMPGGTAGVAERLRRLQVVPRFGTAQQVHQGAGEALERVGHSGRLGEITDELDRTTPVTRARMLDALGRYAESVESDPVMRRFGGAVRRRAEDFAATLPEEINYRRAIEILRGVGDQTTWIDPVSGARPPQDVARGTYRALRRELDDIAEEGLTPRHTDGYRAARSAATEGADRLSEYQQSRLDTQASLFAQDWSGRAMDRLARNRGISPSDYAAGMIGGGGENGSLVRAGLSALANRSWRLREGTARATGAELAQSLMASNPEALGRWATPLREAMQRGASQFAALHMALSSRDPEYRRALAEAEEQQGEQR